MKLGRCPVCHSHLHLDSLIQDDAGRQLLALVSKLGYRMGPPLVAYLGLFRPAKQDLSNSRALKLAGEVLELTGNKPALSEALAETVASIRKKRQNGDVKPLANHNYLKQVLGGVAERKAADARSDTVEVKSSGVRETEEENRRRWQEQMAKLGASTRIPTE